MRLTSSRVKGGTPRSSCCCSPPRRCERQRISGPPFRSLRDSGADSVVTVVELPRHLSPDYVMRVEEGRLVPFLPEGTSITRRQDARRAFVRDGTVYVFWAKTLAGVAQHLRTHVSSARGAGRGVDHDRLTRRTGWTPSGAWLRPRNDRREQRSLRRGSQPGGEGMASGCGGAASRSAAGAACGSAARAGGGCPGGVAPGT